MSWQEDPDRALARWLTERDERYERLQREDRIADYTPAAGGPGPVIPSGRRAEANGRQAPRVTSAMVSLAWMVTNGSWHDARDAAKVLAELVLEAGE